MMPLLSRPSNFAVHDSQATSEIPSIRLITATPSAAGMSSDASNSSSNSFESSWASVSPSVLLPKPDAPNRKRLVPKKSKLGLLTGVKENEKSKGKDFSDVLRRVGADPASAQGGFEIYVDPTNDPELEDVVVVKKRKSRAALNALSWGPLGEVTNVANVHKNAPPSKAVLKVKNEEDKKWWSIGRGRKDSKEKGKKQEVGENVRANSPGVHMRSKTPEPLKSKHETRARFNSLDSGILLSAPVNTHSSGTKASSASEQLPRSHPLPSQRSFTPESLKEACRSASPVPPQRSATPAPTLNGFLAPPNAPPKEQGSIALRAIRSVRSLAKMGSWVQTSQNQDLKKDVTIKQRRNKKEKKSKKKVEEGTLREKKEELDKGISRLSTSSFEAGTLSASPEATSRMTGSQTLGKKKRSILGIGLGLPSSVRLPSARSGSTASSIFLQPNRPPVGNVGIRAKERLGSTISTGSSLRPLSTASSSGASACTGGSRGSIKWDEEGIRSDKREIQKEKKEKKKKKKEKDGTDGGRLVDGWKRTPLSEIFPRAASDSHTSAREVEDEVQRRLSTAYPIVTIEEATVDGHSVADADEIHDSLVYGGIWKEGDTEKDIEATPKKRQRARPVSEQMLGRTRPHAMYEDEEGVLSILDAATNDLAQLINNLDLEATPTTPDMTPMRPSPLPANMLVSIHSGDVSPSKKGKLARGNDSPLKSKSPPNIAGPGNKSLNLRASSSSITSLRPYALSRGTATKTLEMPVFSNSTVKEASIKKKSSEIGIGQPITPWPVLLQQLSPLKDRRSREAEKENAAPKDASSKTGTWKNGHKRTMTPAPEPEPEPVFQPLKPPRSRIVKPAEGQDGKTTLRDTKPTFTPDEVTNANATKGSLSPPKSLRQKASAFLRKSCSLLPIPADVSLGGDLSFATLHSGSDSGSNAGNVDILANGATLVRIPTKKQRRMPATLGGSDVSCYAIPELDASDPDSDIPDELQFILKANTNCRSDETYEFNQGLVSYEEDEEDDDVEQPRSLASPLETFSMMAPDLVPKLPPLFQASLTNEGGEEGAVSDGEHADGESEADTKQSFDFTGELQKLNESGASDRQSFVEQLENAFRTPANIDLKDFGGLLKVEVPPVPRIPAEFLLNKAPMDLPKTDLRTEEDKKPSTKYGEEMQVTGEDTEAFDIDAVSRMVDFKELTVHQPSQDASSGGKDFAPTSNRESLPCPLDAREPTVQSDFYESFMTVSHSSDGKLNTSFKFGGLRSDSVAKRDEKADSNQKPMTLSDIIPPLSHVRSLSSSSNSSENGSVFQSILAKASEIPQPRLRMESIPSERPRNRNSIYRQSRASSALSFTGFDSFEEVRRGFEFHPNNPPVFFPPPPTNARRNNRYRDSLLSIATVSSYGHVINPGVPDPFDYGLPSLQERPSSEDLSSVSFSIDDTFSFLNHASRRRRVDSDASSFYFKAPLSRGNHRPMSVISPAPPISFYNRNLGAHCRNDSGASSVSRNAWRSSHRYSDSVDSILSDFSAMRLGRPGLGDKMFEMVDQTMSLAPITASPDNSTESQSPSSSADVPYQPTYDSIIDGDRRSSMNVSDSIFDRTGQRTCTVSDDSVFGRDSDSRFQFGFLPPHQFRPLSIISMESVHSPAKEGDTLISMLGGGHVRRRSLDSIIETSPCARVEKRKHATFSGSNDGFRDDTPNKARIVENNSMASSVRFDAERLAEARNTPQERSLEDSVLIGDGEDSSLSLHSIPVFSRPVPASRSRSSTCTSSSGGDTPPLSASDGSSISGSSMSSIDLSEINFILSNTAHLTSTLQHARARAHLHGHGHRRRYSLMRNSRSESVYETIEEERLSPISSPARSIFTEKTSSPTQCLPVFVVDEDTAMIHANSEESVSIWDDEKGIIALRKFYALRDEAENTVMESKRKWSDTPFSIFAVQSFQPPRHPEGMQALLQQSVQNYGPLPSELRSRRMRSRKDSRPSPYPQNRVAKTTTPPDACRTSPIIKPAAETVAFKPLLPQSLFSMKRDNNIPAVAPSLDTIKPLSPMVLNANTVNRKTTTGVIKENNNGEVRCRTGSEARRTALGWTKRNSGAKGSICVGNGNIMRGKLSTGATTMSTDQKENAVGLGSISTPGDTLRMNRPRPKGRRTPASTVKKVQKPIRV